VEDVDPDMRASGQRQGEGQGGSEGERVAAELVGALQRHVECLADHGLDGDDE